MNDFQKAAKNIGNRFDLVLVASERMRELHAERRKQYEEGSITTESIRRDKTPSEKTFNDIENGTVGKEYLGRIKKRYDRIRKPKFEEIR